MSELLAIDLVRIDGGTQPRVSMDVMVVADYADAMRGGAVFPPIVLFFDGTDYWLADGFHRLKAAQEAALSEIAADVRQGTLEEARWHSYSANKDHGLHRSNEDKRRAIRAALRFTYEHHNPPKSDRDVADHCGVSQPFVSKVRAELELSENGFQIGARRLVTRNGVTYEMNTKLISESNIGRSIQPAPEAVNLLRQTPIADRPYEAQRLFSFDPDVQVRAAEKIASGDVSSVRAAVLAVQREDRDSAIVTTPLPSGIYRVIYADPPWSYSNSGFSQSSNNHYPTMTTQEISDLPVNTIACGDSVLFLWATSPLLTDALKVITAWGATYRASMVWDKGKAPGIGWFVSTEHEFLLIATWSGNLHPKDKPASIIRSPSGEHSRKPDEVYEIIERMYVGPYVELFARHARHGWSSWGNQLTEEGHAIVGQTADSTEADVR